MARRVYCAGVMGQPCHAHAWVYYEGDGRPVERCPICRREHERERRRRNHENDRWKAAQLRLAGVA